MAAICRVLQDRRSCLCILRVDGPPLPLLPFRVVHEYVCFAVRERAATARSGSAAEFSLEHAISGRLFRSPFQTGEVNFSIRPSAAFSDCIAVSSMEAALAGSSRIPRRRFLTTLWLHRLLRQIHLLGGRFRLGRSVRLDLGGNGRDACRATADSLSRKSKHMVLARWIGNHLRQPDHSVCVASLLASARNLSDGDSRPSYIRDRS